MKFAKFCFVALLSFLSPLLVKLELLVYEKEIPKPTSENFAACHNHIFGNMYSCWINEATAFQVDLDDMLKRWPTTRPDCYAVWCGLECIEIKRSTYDQCKSIDVINYFKQIKNKYSEQGCQPHWAKPFSCSAAINSRLSLSLIFIVTILAYARILSCNL